MKLSILIVNWNTGNLIGRCVRSILENPPGFEFEIIVFDNASTDNSFKQLKQNFQNNDKVKLVESKKNLGFARGNNEAYKHSRGEYVLLLNPDTEIIDDALPEMLRCMDREEQVGALGPKLKNPDGSLQPSVRKFPDIWSSILIFSGLHRFFPPNKYLMKGFDYESYAKVDQVMGAALLTKKTIIEKYGLFDERFYLWYEEVDFCQRVKQAGFKVVYCPSAEIVHVRATSFSQLAVFDRKYTVAKSLRYYFKKHGSLFERIVLELSIWPILAFAWIWNLLGINTKIKT